MALQREPVYLDYQASTPIDPRISEFLHEIQRTAIGNPSSAQHSFGMAQRVMLEESRAKVAAAIGAQEREILFTSGATEANNLALLGWEASEETPKHLVTCAAEHPAVLEPIRALSSNGWRVSFVAVDSEGRPDLDELDQTLSRGAALVSIMAANNELGTINPLKEISEIARSHGVPFHTDAAQAVGNWPIDVQDLGVDMLSLSGHKFYGPQGTGALFIRHEFLGRYRPVTFGGGQERGLRSGTPNTAGNSAMGMACQIATDSMNVENLRIRDLRDRLASRLLDLIPGSRLNGPSLEKRLPGNIHMTFFDADAEAVMANCPLVAMATGSACASSAPAPSHVLTAIGMPSDEAECSLRLSLGRFTTTEEIDFVAEEITSAVAAVRERTPVSSWS